MKHEASFRAGILTLVALCRVAAALDLTVNLVGPGRIDPSAGTYPEGTVVPIQVWPDEGHWVRSWNGTDDDSSIELTNMVTMDSNETVTVELAPSIIVGRPAAGDAWAAGSMHNIRWSSYGAGDVDILFSKNGGFSWQAVAGAVSDTGSFQWEVPAAVDSDNCVVLVIPSVFDVNSISIPSASFQVKPYSPGTAVTPKWQTLGGDFQRRGRSNYSGPKYGCVRWEFEVDGAISASVTVGHDGSVYVPCEDSNLYKLDANGSLLWSYKADSPLISAATLGADGTACVGNKDGKLYAIDIDGNLRWTHTTGGIVYSSPAVSADGNHVYVCSQDGKLYALGRDGSELWDFETKGFGQLGGAILASPAVAADGTVYIGGLYDPNLYALDPNDGSVKWTCHFDSNGSPFASPVIAADGTIYQTLLDDPYLYAINPNDGSIIWQTNLADTGPDSTWFEPYYYYGIRQAATSDRCIYTYADYDDVSLSGWTEPVLGPDGTIYVSLDDPYLRAIDPNGSIKWITRLGIPSKFVYADGDLGYGIYRVGETLGGFTLTVGVDGLIYAASDKGYLYVVEPNGQRLSRFESANWPQMPVVSAQNTIMVTDSADSSMLISCTTNKLRAISADSCQGQQQVLYWYGIQDLNGDAAVDFYDHSLLATDWQECTDCSSRTAYSQCRPWRVLSLPGDISKDNYVNFNDVALLAAKWLERH
ncbi:MAG: outer membrane protein assembly factor BamB family protein [Planctomycetota bacterium]|jgi:outer membrane protein assembly factor BamB